LFDKQDNKFDFLEYCSVIDGSTQQHAGPQASRFPGRPDPARRAVPDPHVPLTSYA
jgi:hypothetical protein